jgi:ribosome-binding ATPase
LGIVKIFIDDKIVLMSLSIGIVGLPNVGKSTLFNALLKRQAALAANYPFATIEPNIGVVDVPDERLNKLVELVRNDYGSKVGDREVPQKVIPAVVKFYDIAGLVKGASQGEGLGNEFLGHIREVDATVQVVRGFHDEKIVRAGSVDPQGDVETLNTELILSDLQVLEKVMERLERENKSKKSKEVTQLLSICANIKKCLDEGRVASEVELDLEEQILAGNLHLLTLKPMIYVLNVDEEEVSKSIEQYNDSSVGEAITVSAKIEQELSTLSEKERKAFMEDLNINMSGLDKIIRKGYEILGLETFFTAGPKEVRAWTIQKGSKAPKAAGKIHTDFERGFISAEVVNFNEIAKVSGWKEAKEKGLVRLEGKNYTMKDGDIVEFHFSV